MMSGNLLLEKSKVLNPAGKPKDEVDWCRPVFRTVFIFPRQRTEESQEDAKLWQNIFLLPNL
ncbi:MAG: hypothetical protein ACFWTN_08125 [Clostridium sp.]|jgi:hypothetical protein